MSCNFVLEAPATMLAPSCIRLDNIGGMERREDLHGQIPTSHKKSCPRQRPGEGITLQAQIYGFWRTTDTIIIIANIYD